MPRVLVGVIAGGSNDGPLRFFGPYTFHTRWIGGSGCGFLREIRRERLDGLLAAALGNCRNRLAHWEMRRTCRSYCRGQRHMRLADRVRWAAAVFPNGLSRPFARRRRRPVDDCRSRPPGIGCGRHGFLVFGLPPRPPPADAASDSSPGVIPRRATEGIRKIVRRRTTCPFIVFAELRYLCDRIRTRWLAGLPKKREHGAQAERRMGYPHRNSVSS